MEKYSLLDQLEAECINNGWVYLAGSDFYQNYESTMQEYEAGQYVLGVDFIASDNYNESGSLVGINYIGSIRFGRKKDSDETYANLDETFKQKHDRRLKELKLILSNFISDFACANQLSITNSVGLLEINKFDANIDFVGLQITFNQEDFDFETPVYYDLIMEALTGGTTYPASGTYSYPENTIVPIHAIADTGYRFVRWLIAGVENLSALTYVKMTNVKNAVAEFIASWTLTTSVDGAGTISPESGVYDDGEEITFEAIPTDPETDQFDKFTRNGVDLLTNPYTENASEDVNMVAYFSSLLQQHVSFDNTLNTVLNVESEDFNFTSGIPFSISTFVNINDIPIGGESALWYRGSDTVTVSFIVITRSNATTYALSFRLYNTGLTKSIIVTSSINYLSGWNHIGLSYDGTDANGVILCANANELNKTISSNTLDAPNPTSYPNAIGRTRTRNSYGAVDDFIIFNKALSVDEFDELYIFNYKSSIADISTYDNIISYWTFNGDLIDSVGNNDLTSTSPNFTDSNANAYISNSGNDTTAELDSEILKYETIDGALLALIDNDIRYNSIYLEEGDFISPNSDNIIHNLSIIGALMPVVDSELSPTKLMTGTVLKGGLSIRNTIYTKLYNFGVDVGEVWCTDNNVPLGTNGLAFNSTAGISSTHIIENIVALCKSADVAYHAMIFEFIKNMSISNIKAYYSVHGIVFKTNNVIASNIESYGNNGDGVIIKKDFDFPVENIAIDGFKYRNIGSSDPAVAQIAFENDDLTEGNINNITITNADLELESVSNRLDVIGTITDVTVTDLNGDPIT